MILIQFVGFLVPRFKSKSVVRSKSLPPKRGAPELGFVIGVCGMVGADPRSALVDAGQCGAVGGPSGTASPPACPPGVPGISADPRMLGQLMVEKFTAPCADPVSLRPIGMMIVWIDQVSGGVSGGTIRILAVYVCKGRI